MRKIAEKAIRVLGTIYCENYKYVKTSVSTFQSTKLKITRLIYVVQINIWMLSSNGVQVRKGTIIPIWDLTVYLYFINQFGRKFLGCNCPNLSSFLAAK